MTAEPMRTNVAPRETGVPGASLFEIAEIPMIHVRFRETEESSASGGDVDSGGSVFSAAIVHANHAARNFFEDCACGSVESFVRDLFSGDRGKLLVDRLDMTGEGGEAVGEEFPLPGRDGGPLSVNVTFFRFSVPDGGNNFLLCLTANAILPGRGERMFIPFDFLVQFPLPVLIADLSGRIIRCSDRIGDVFGYSVDELIGEPVGVLYHPPARAEQEWVIRKTLQRVGTFSGTLHCVRKDGTDLTVEVCSRQIRGTGGEAFARVEVYRDDTEWKRVERELIESEKRYRGVIESQSDLIVRFDPDGLFTFANDAYCLKFGKSRKHLIGKPFVHLVHEDDLPITLQAMRNLETPPYRVSIEQRALTVNGWRWIAWENYAIKDETGRTVEVQGVGRDISGYKRMQADLLHEIELIKLISSISSSFIDLPSGDVDGGIGRALERIGRFIGSDRVNVYLIYEGVLENRYGWKEKGVPSQKGKLHEMNMEQYPWWMEKLNRFENIHIPSIDMLPPDADMERQVLTALSIRSMVVVPMVYNQELRGFLSLVSVRDEKAWREEDVALLSTVADIFVNALQHQRAEEEIERSKWDLQRSERLAATGRLAASIAHEINNPLQAITANIGYLTKMLPDDMQEKRVLEQVKVGILRIRNTVRQLLDIHRSKSGVTEDVQVNEIIESTLGLVENQLVINKIEVEKNLEPELPMIRGLAQELFQVFMNIILNAMDAMPKGGRISIRTSHAGNGVRIVFRDTGHGISEDDMEHIFDPFFTTKSKMLGTGLGLSIVKGIVESFGGEITVKSAEGKGASFIFAFPVS